MKKTNNMTEFNKLQVTDIVMQQSFRNQKIISDVLSALPVGCIPNHTPENITDRIKDLVKEHAHYHAVLERISEGTRYSKDLAQNAIGYTDNHEQQIELLREENLMLKLKLEELENKAVKQS
jgi:hypothetical protein